MSNRILSYRNKIADGGQDTILLSTKKGEVGYRIKKFQAIDDEPGEVEVEMVVKVYSEPPTTVDNTVNFSDNTLLGVVLYANQGNQSVVSSETIIFDNSIFNQDIYVTAFSWEGSPGCNYYLELEVIKLDESQAMVATLKDIRNNS
ncbi:MAG: hypothetical protein [Circular genetic element sp.]|nr:MAG: hypothetical protein [Circular genetic element sp.]